MLFEYLWGGPQWQMTDVNTKVWEDKDYIQLKFVKFIVYLLADKTENLNSKFYGNWLIIIALLSAKCD
jgi:hypothetical protein